MAPSIYFIKGGDSQTAGGENYRCSLDGRRLEARRSRPQASTVAASARRMNSPLALEYSVPLVMPRAKIMRFSAS